MASNTGTVVAAVGQRLRDIRLQNGTSQAELAQTTGISESTLSRLETGLRKPTLEMLLALAKVHDMTLDDLIHGPVDEDPRIDQRPFERWGMTFVPLSRDRGGLQAYKQILPGRDKPAKLVPRTHDGFDWIYVLSGRLRLVLGRHDLVLGPGEVVEFDTRVPHAYASAGPRRTEILSLFGHQGERMHIRAKMTGGVTA